MIELLDWKFLSKRIRNASMNGWGDLEYRQSVIGCSCYLYQEDCHKDTLMQLCFCREVWCAHDEILRKTRPIQTLGYEGLIFSPDTHLDYGQRSKLQ